MQRLAALVPRPRLHLTRFHGVLAPNAGLRVAIVPGPAQDASPVSAVSIAKTLRSSYHRFLCLQEYGYCSALFSSCTCDFDEVAAFAG